MIALRHRAKESLTNGFELTSFSIAPHPLQTLLSPLSSMSRDQAKVRREGAQGRRTGRPLKRIDYDRYHIAESYRGAPHHAKRFHFHWTPAQMCAQRVLCASVPTARAHVRATSGRPRAAGNWGFFHGGNPSARGIWRHATWREAIGSSKTEI